MKCRDEFELEAEVFHHTELILKWIQEDLVKSEKEQKKIGSLNGNRFFVAIKKLR